MTLFVLWMEVREVGSKQKGPPKIQSCYFAVLSRQTTITAITLKDAPKKEVLSKHQIQVNVYNYINYKTTSSWVTKVVFDH